MTKLERDATNARDPTSYMHHPRSARVSTSIRAAVGLGEEIGDRRHDFADVEWFADERRIAETLDGGRGEAIAVAAHENHRDAGARGEKFVGENEAVIFLLE